MSTLIQPLSWDSNFLGFPVGRLEGKNLSVPDLQQALAQARQANYRLLYWFVAPHDATAHASAKAVRAPLVDRKVRLVAAVASGQTTNLPLGVNPVTTFSPLLEVLAIQAGEYSRFRRDPTFGFEVLDRLYGEWLRRSLTGEVAREVLVYQAQPNQPARGLLVLGQKNGRVEVVLLAVDPAWRGQGIGTALLAAARCRAATWGHSTIQVVTQADNPAGRLYRRAGFEVEHEEHVYHLWV